jgi:alkylation response protein AidB-like acyl-CoA dehydrogenase
VGEENRGWYVGMATMDFERSAIAASGGLRRGYEDLVGFVRDAGPNVVAMNRAAARNELAEIGIEIEVARMLSLRVLSLQQAGQVPNYEASIAKMLVRS